MLFHSSLRIAGCRGTDCPRSLICGFLWHETFLNSSSFLPLVVKHLFEYRAFRCGEYEYIPYAKKCQGYFSFFLDFFDFFFCAALRLAQGPGAGFYRFPGRSPESYDFVKRVTKKVTPVLDFLSGNGKLCKAFCPA